MLESNIYVFWNLLSDAQNTTAGFSFQRTLLVYALHKAGSGMAAGRDSFSCYMDKLMCTAISIKVYFVGQD